MDAVVAAPQPVTYPLWLQELNRNPTPDSLLMTKAFEFAKRLHWGQKRKSGEDYIVHPVAVATLLWELGGDAQTVAAGFLHDVLEDTQVTAETLTQEFGPEVTRLVEGVTKLSKFSFSSKTERQAESFRRMFLAMAQDIRVIVVKLADRLHNMRTLEYLEPETQRRIAQETLDIFAPLANRLGIWRFKWELEDLAFKYLEPEAYRQMQQYVMEKRADREAYIGHVIGQLQDKLQEAGIPFIEMTGRPKHLYSIYQKMRRQQKEFHEIMDLAAVRIIVNTVDECYRALAVVHNAFTPVPGRFKDYIGLPKPNNYQSLHTVVIGPKGKPVEVQIRTLAMHYVAEYGIAAHWKYKEAGASVKTSHLDERFTWLRQLLEWQQDLKDAQEYVDNLKDNLFEQEVYVFTPKGDVVDLKAGATPVDFAYRIHTEVGNHCWGARVNGRLVPLHTPLKNGDIVEILTRENARPSLDWLNFVVTNTARNRIRQWYKKFNREEHIAQGKALLEAELGRTGLDNLLKSDLMLQVAQRCNYAQVEDLLAALGYGEISLKQVIGRWQEVIKQQTQSPAETGPLETSPETKPTPAGEIASLQGLAHHLAHCCYPIPGEPIVGVVTLGGRGISIHRQDCANLKSIPVERLLPVSWDGVEDRRQTYPVMIQVTVIDRVGVLRDVLSRLSDQRINVSDVRMTTHANQTAVITLRLDVLNREQLQTALSHVRKMSDVLHLQRVGQA
ncbi:MAG: bifunctional (p)ppGpp synthetase/guanosine-3',5'-bis(diphosphate) 3'-pyrophosphohydrolase [Gloeomargarita sp. SKYBB_i_bin120]|nr:bifunctional (p)ppGpp synthetase/guanosine-3',5'-bis(diphosphate) 3'-pyrophosphohydrolase [Gloeomargarita sp. SKYG98]MCS7293177.1 bifunctional (p)ppGpp synthetase/guanosine-3',5'-bis(diphosphate) 3'-pyrophosphohydrolase [Gloeomargarita sp. SKYB120]MDW8178742.1 bifunctional (p)ppGpp synthetase/guanosine-3',5'-bis(diphosphate) 3'-pyrophosphohydrolase [Gloeomargarita sp. SKYBB_i_bin120]